jgi:hypothetical protein
LGIGGGVGGRGRFWIRRVRGGGRRWRRRRERVFGEQVGDDKGDLKVQYGGSFVIQIIHRWPRLLLSVYDSPIFDEFLSKSSNTRCTRV